MRLFSAYVSLAAGLLCGLPAHAEILDLTTITMEAVGHSFDVSTAKARAKQYSQDVIAARADYYPTLNLVASSEYDKSLAKNSSPNSTYMSIAGTTYLGYTRFQNAAGLSAQWTLLDYGVRRNNVRAAKKSAESSLALADVSVRDVKLAITDLYAEVLGSYKDFQAKQQSVPIYRSLYEMKRRLYKSGNISKVDLGEYSLKLAESEDALRETREVLTKKLNELTAYTHRIYNIESLTVIDFGQTEAPSMVLVFKPETTPDFKQFNAQIESKRAEMRSLLGQRFPQLRAYGGFTLYGFSPNNPAHALSAFGPRLAYGGVSVQWPLFDGFKLAAQYQRKRYEIEELTAQRDKKLWQLKSDYDKASASLTPLGAQMVTKAEIIGRGEEKINMYDRLCSRNLADPTELLMQKARLIDQQLAAEKISIQRKAAEEKLRILAGG